MNWYPIPCLQGFVISYVTGNILFYFFYPVLPIMIKLFLAFIPILSMPKLAINKYCNMIFLNSNIWRPRQRFIITLITKSFMPKSFG